MSEAIIKALGYAIWQSGWQLGVAALLVWAVLKVFSEQKALQRYWILVSIFFGSVGLIIVQFLEKYFSYQITTPQEQVQYWSQIAAYRNNTPEKIAIWENLESFYNQNAQLIAILWAIGAFILALRYLGSFYVLNKIRTFERQKIDKKWHFLKKKLCLKMNMNPNIDFFESPLVSSPITFGWLKPVIVVPVGMLASLSYEQIEAILAHELSHIHRKDYFINLIQSLAEILFFYHPAIWWISEKIRLEREKCCDDKAVAVCGNALLYARTLTFVQENFWEKQPSLSLSFQKNLKKRLQRLSLIHHFSIHFQTQNTLFMNAVTKKSALSIRIFRLFGQNASNPTDRLTVALMVFAMIFASFMYQPSFSQDQKSTTLYMLDGKEVSEQDFKAAEKNIRNLNVFKGTKALEKYGKENVFIATTTPENEEGSKKIQIIEQEIVLDTDGTKKNVMVFGDSIKRKIVIKMDSVGNGKTMNFTWDSDGEPRKNVVFIGSEKMFCDSTFKFNFEFDKDSTFNFDFKKMGNMPSIQHFGDSTKKMIVIETDKKIIRMDGGKNGVFMVKRDEQKPIFVIDGQLANGLEDVDADQIKSVNVLKGNKATKKYGEKAKNGVVEITTKNSKANDKKARQEAEKSILEQNRLSVYPNPSNTKNLNVDFDNPEKQELTVSLFDLEGKLVRQLQSGSHSKGKIKFSFGGLDLKGLFILKVSTPKGEWNQKIVLD